MAVETKTLPSHEVIRLCELPEGCIANILSFTSPLDACRLSLVGSAFQSAELSDEICNRFLADSLDVLSRSPEGGKLLSSPISRKDLYLNLCDHPILIDAGTKSFWLEKSSGKKCYMLAASHLKIVWSDTPDYWRWIPIPESWFSSVAELIAVCWLELRGAIKTSMLSPHTTYAAYLVFTMTQEFHGFKQPPAEASVGFSGQEGQKQAVLLNANGEGSLLPRLHRQQYNFRHARTMVGHEDTANGDNGTNVRHTKQRGDGWMEVELGEIFIDGGEDMELEIGLTEIKGGHWKYGLVIEGIEIRPKKVN